MNGKDLRLGDRERLRIFPSSGRHKCALGNKRNMSSSPSRCFGTLETKKRKVRLSRVGLVKKTLSGQRNRRDEVHESKVPLTTVLKVQRRKKENKEGQPLKETSRPFNYLSKWTSTREYTSRLDE